MLLLVVLLVSSIWFSRRWGMISPQMLELGLIILSPRTAMRSLMAKRKWIRWNVTRDLWFPRSETFKILCGQVCCCHVLNHITRFHCTILNFLYVVPPGWRLGSLLNRDWFVSSNLQFSFRTAPFSVLIFIFIFCGWALYATLSPCAWKPQPGYDHDWSEV